MKKLLLILLILPLFTHAQWYQLDSITDETLRSVFFTNADTGYVAGDNGTLFKTTDTGENWTPLSINTDYDIYDICFPAEDTGYIICSKWEDWEGERFKIFKTINGGTSWVNQDSLIGCDNFGWMHAIDFLDDKTGMIVGNYDDCAKILFTRNGGITWKFFDLIDNIGYPDNVYTYLNDIAIYDSTHAVAVGVGDAYHTFEFVDDTIVWNCLSEGEPGMSNELYAVCFADENTVFTAGQGGRIHKIVDGNWCERETYVIDTPHNEYFRAIEFVSDNTGFVGGGDIYKTNNGGILWSEQGLQSVHDIKFVNHFVGYTVGHNGVIMKTINGGDFINLDLFSRNADIYIYPNPTKDYIYIMTDFTQHGTIKFRILDINGKTVGQGEIHKEGINKISLAGLKSGRYFLKLINSKEEIICKSFVKL